MQGNVESCRFPTDASTARSEPSPSIIWKRPASARLMKFFERCASWTLRHLHRRPRADEWLLAERIFSGRAIAAMHQQMPLGGSSCRNLSWRVYRYRTEPWEIPRGSRTGFYTPENTGRKFISIPTVRAGISFLRKEFVTPEETADGMREAQRGHSSQAGIKQVMARYRHDLGDYLFVFATKLS